MKKTQRKSYYKGFEFWSIKMGSHEGFWRTFYRKYENSDIFWTSKRDKTLASSRKTMRSEIDRIIAIQIEIFGKPL